MNNVKKTVKIKESELVDLIDNIVSEAIVVKKQEWLAEQKANSDKESLLENKINELEKKFNDLVKAK